MYYLTSYYICCKLRYFAAFCSKIIIFWESNLPESIWNVKLPLCTSFGSNQCIILQVNTFAANYAILQHFAANFSRKQPSWVNPECQIAPVYQFWKYSMYHLTSYYICCKLRYFAAFCSKLIIFWESNHPESIQNVKLPLCTNFESNQCIILQVITFAANYAILQHFAAN